MKTSKPLALRFSKVTLSLHHLALTLNKKVYNEPLTSTSQIIPYFMFDITMIELKKHHFGTYKKMKTCVSARNCLDQGASS